MCLDAGTSRQRIVKAIPRKHRPVKGVSTRRMEKLAASLGIESLSASQVSEMTKGLNEQVEQFRNRNLSEQEYPFLWVDALYEKIRQDGRVINMAVQVVCGVNSNGYREVLAIEPMLEESKETYKQLFSSLKERGLSGVQLVVSDAHAGLQEAIKECFTAAGWQRCKVHFMRNIMAHVPHKEKVVFAAQLKQIWTSPTMEIARQRADSLTNVYQKRFPKAILILERGLEDSLQFFSFPEIDARKISSTNLMERLNQVAWASRQRIVKAIPRKHRPVQGVSTRRMEKLAASLGIERLSASQVSEMTKGLNEQVEDFRNRDLSDKEYPFIWVDALIRQDGRVINMAVLVVCGVNSDGYREVLAIEPMLEESKETYKQLFSSLKERGLSGVQLVVSDAHAGLREAIKECFTATGWQRCKVHFMRNIMAHVPHKEKLVFTSQLKQIWTSPTIEIVKQRAENLTDVYQNRFPKAIQTMEQGLEDSLQFFSFPEIDARKISSTNLMERLNQVAWASRCVAPTSQRRCVAGRM